MGALRKLGADIREARARRSLPLEVVAERAFTTRQTLARVERGDHGVSVGIYAAALNALGLLDRVADLADPAHDPVGATLAAEALPKRVRLPGKKKTGGPGGRRAINVGLPAAPGARDSDPA